MVRTTVRKAIQATKAVISAMVATAQPVAAGGFLIASHTSASLAAAA
jgi:hypothetical protein